MNYSLPIYNDIGSTPYYFIGNQSLLTCSPIAVYCSREIPLSIYHTVNETFTEILRLPIVIGGGWQSTMEKRALRNYSKEANSGYLIDKVKTLHSKNLRELSI